MAKDNVDLIQDAWDAFGRGDLDGATQNTAPEGEIVVPETLPWGGNYRGPEGLRALIESIAGHFQQLKITPEKVLGADDDHVIVVARASGRTKAGNQVDNRAAWVYQLRNGEVTRAEQFTDTAKALQALGQ